MHTNSIAINALFVNFHLNTRPGGKGVPGVRLYCSQVVHILNM